MKPVLLASLLLGLSASAWANDEVQDRRFQGAGHSSHAGKSMGGLEYGKHVLNSQKKAHGLPYKDSFGETVYGNSGGYGGYAKGHYAGGGSILAKGHQVGQYCLQNPYAAACRDDNNGPGVAPSRPAAQPASGNLVAVGDKFFPACSSPAVDEDGDSWGWENNTSCKVVYSYCSSADSDVDGDGWGWENNQSCVVGN